MNLQILGYLFDVDSAHSSYLKTHENQKTCQVGSCKNLGFTKK